MLPRFAPDGIGQQINEMNDTIREIGKLLWYVEDVFYLLNDYKMRLIQLRDTQQDFVTKVHLSNDQTRSAITILHLYLIFFIL